MQSHCKLRNWSLTPVLLCLAGCPAPQQGGTAGFSGGDRWAFPLVGPLEDGLLVTPVMINGHGPYLFQLDPDASRTVIDGDVVKTAELAASKGPPVIDHAGTAHPAIYAEVTGLEIGSLVIDQRLAIVVKPGTFTLSGRMIQGVIGRDVISEDLVFGFDRDQGLGFLALAKPFQPTTDAIAVPYTLAPGTTASVVPRRLADVTIGDEVFSMHLDLGHTASQLRASSWDRAKLVAREIAASFIDEVGMPHRVTQVSDPVGVSLRGARNDRIAMIPFDDPRWPESVHGSLGLGFFAPYDVWAHWSARTVYLTKRTDVSPAKRFTRWDSGPLEKCKSVGCLTIRLVDPLAGKPVEQGTNKPHPGLVLSITRDETAGGMGLEVMLEAADRPELPRLLVNLPPNIDRLIEQLDARFVGATLVVLDASPYPRACPGANGCVDKLQR